MFPSGNGGFKKGCGKFTKLDRRRYVNQRLLNIDGRFAKNIEYIFAMQYATTLEHINSNVSLALRLKKGKMFRGKKVTAGMLSDPLCVQNMVR